ncbi:MAG TPA: glycosyltransferase family 2 protein [Saprospiraceae bacterium]|nr:glycosyltransferase family 2 protein [Saprospiraceae bacterium]MCB9327426.1 glycosyltransferase family 2 protein [Lewinellaceae bacterium]HPK09420.1 glycosyltransferase family 2 protein [Saprospiraceae bacterium]HPQ20920.1 glycosyltransferase family 2 protein [Saprospiraceae bacterium]HRX28419.1 glycosyltransferase family 2 protein [Saprospiraceae bacterium]
MIDKSDIYICLPAYNEASVIGSVIKSIHENGFENIIVIDDGSDDNTTDIASTFGIRTLKLPINRGVGAATQLAIEYARNKKIQYLMLMDADGQHSAECLHTMIETMRRHQADIVIGNRFVNEENIIPTKRRLYNFLANIFTNMLVDHEHDSQSGFRLLNRKAIDALNLEIDGYGVCSEMIWKAKKLELNIMDAPIKVSYTDYSLSKGQNFGKGVKTALSLINKKLKL